MNLENRIRKVIVRTKSARSPDISTKILKTVPSQKCSDKWLRRNVAHKTFTVKRLGLGYMI